MTVTNRGVAPIYHDAYLAVNGVRSERSLKGLLPGESRTDEIAVRRRLAEADDRVRPPRAGAADRVRGRPEVRPGHDDSPQPEPDGRALRRRPPGAAVLFRRRPQRPEPNTAHLITYPPSALSR